MPKRHAAAFLGSLHPKRVEVLRRLGIALGRMAPVSAPDPVRSLAPLAEILVHIRQAEAELQAIAAASRDEVAGAQNLRPGLDQPIPDVEALRG